MEKITMVLKPTRENIKRVAKAMSFGAIVIYPTESSYAIGCDFTNDIAVKQINKIKKRSKAKHLINIVSDSKMVEKYGKLDDTSTMLMKRFMPGPLTLIIPGKYKLDKFRFRISENRVARILANELGKPIVATSANFSGKENIYNSQELEQFFGHVDAILDSGTLPQREVSTVVEVTKNKAKIIREGAIKKDKIKKYLK